MDSYDGYPQNDDQLNDCLAAGDDEAWRSLKMTIKVPPAFNGHVQTQGYFAYEDSVEEWVSITSVEKDKRGPLLKNRLLGEAIRLKPLFDTDSLKDPDNGVAYFLSVLYVGDTLWNITKQGNTFTKVVAVVLEYLTKESRGKMMQHEKLFHLISVFVFATTILEILFYYYCNHSCFVFTPSS